MAIYKIFPEKDASIYSEFPLLNTGLDEILSVSTYYNTLYPNVSRFLIQFSQTEIEDIINTKISGSVTDATGSLITGSNAAIFKSNLRCFVSDITGLNSNTTLKIYPISGSWNMGTGRYPNNPQTTNGVGWTYRSSNGVNAWPSTFNPYVTSSYSGSNIGGGTWYTGSSLGLNVTASQELSYSSNKDLNVDVTNTVLNWYSASNSLGGFSNNGFIVKQSDSDEFIADRNYVTTVDYFSIDTHTIYPPQLEFKWSDFSFNTGSSTNTIINTSRMVATLDNNGGTYRRGSVEKFRINSRPQFPIRVFQTASIYTTNNYLPTASYYAVKDLDTNEFVIDFDTTYTKISADDESSYFTLYMSGLEPERYYQILIKTEIGGEVLILSDNYYFKVING
tara:strand:- start:1280 stop:2455 length:1176 start_codon:yes stop_codon:yes gene_type:complete